jgi:PAS domain-containing protein
VTAHPAGLEVLHLNEHPLHCLSGLRRACLGEHDRELVAADPAGEVRPSRAGSDQPSDCAEEQISRAVPVLEVEVPEAVDVEHRDRERALVPLGALDVEVELGAERSQREQVPGDRVSRAGARQLDFELADSLPRGGKLGGKPVTVPREHLFRRIGGVWRTLECTHAQLLSRDGEGGKNEHMEALDSPRGQRPLELILARNLLTSISTPAFLIDDQAAVVFYNEAAAALLGRSFEDAGRMTAEEWTTTFGPMDSNGRPLAVDQLAITDAIRGGRPAHGEFRIRAAGGEEQAIEASAFPIVASDSDSSGAMILFWPLGEEE